MKCLSALFLSGLIVLPVFGIDPNLLPEIPATVDGQPVSREEVIRRLPPDWNGLDRKLTLRAIQEAIYAKIIRDALSAAGERPNETTTQQALREFNTLLPSDMPKRSEEEILTLAKSPDLQLNTALHRYFMKIQPELMAISDAEIEEFYRLNQMKFITPASVTLGIIQIAKSRKNAEELARDTRARLQQGENFDRVAKEISPNGSTAPTSELMSLFQSNVPQPKKNMITPILQDNDNFFIIKVKELQPATSIPLQKIEPFLRAQLEARRTGEVLELFLKRELMLRKIKISDY